MVFNNFVSLLIGAAAVATTGQAISVQANSGPTTIQNLLSQITQDTAIEGATDSATIDDSVFAGSEIADATTTEETTADDLTNLFSADLSEPTTEDTLAENAGESVNPIITDGVTNCNGCGCGCGGSCSCNCDSCCECPHLCDIHVCDDALAYEPIYTTTCDETSVTNINTVNVPETVNEEVSACNTCGLSVSSNKACGCGCTKKTFKINGCINVTETLDTNICNGERTCTDGRYHKTSETLERVDAPGCQDPGCNNVCCCTTTSGDCGACTTKNDTCGICYDANGKCGDCQTAGSGSDCGLLDSSNICQPIA